MSPVRSGNVNGAAAASDSGHIPAGTVVTGRYTSDIPKHSPSTSIVGDVKDANEHDGIYELCEEKILGQTATPPSDDADDKDVLGGMKNAGSRAHKVGDTSRLSPEDRTGPEILPNSTRAPPVSKSPRKPWFKYEIPTLDSIDQWVSVANALASVLERLQNDLRKLSEETQRSNEGDHGAADVNARIKHALCRLPESEWKQISALFTHGNKLATAIMREQMLSGFSADQNVNFTLLQNARFIEIEQSYPCTDGDPATDPGYKSSALAEETAKIRPFLVICYNNQDVYGFSLKSNGGKPFHQLAKYQKMYLMPLQDVRHAKYVWDKDTIYTQDFEVLPNAKISTLIEKVDITTPMRKMCGNIVPESLELLMNRLEWTGRNLSKLVIQSQMGSARYPTGPIWYSGTVSRETSIYRPDATTTQQDRRKDTVQQYQNAPHARSTSPVSRYRDGGSTHSYGAQTTEYHRPKKQINTTRRPIDSYRPQYLPHEDRSLKQHEANGVATKATNHVQLNSQFTRLSGLAASHAAAGVDRNAYVASGNGAELNRSTIGNKKQAPKRSDRVTRQRSGLTSMAGQFNTFGMDSAQNSAARYGGRAGNKRRLYTEESERGGSSARSITKRQKKGGHNGFGRS